MQTLRCILSGQGRTWVTTPLTLPTTSGAVAGGASGQGGFREAAFEVSSYKRTVGTYRGRM